jgi:Flp pilus assembly protein TadG
MGLVPLKSMSYQRRKIRKPGIRGFFREELGVELVEFAFTLPILAILLMGGIEFGRAFYTYNMLTKSVRNAARYLSTQPIASTGVFDPTIAANAQKVAVYGNPAGTGSALISGLTTSNISIPAGNVVSTTKIYITVSASYPYPSLFSFIIPSSTFQPSVTMISGGWVTY